MFMDAPGRRVDEASRIEDVATRLVRCIDWAAYCPSSNVIHFDVIDFVACKVFSCSHH